MGHEGETARLIAGAHDGGVRVDTAEVIVAAKSSRGFRPVASLALPDRVLYRALVDAFDPALPVPDRSDDAFAAFNGAPVEVATTAYVARADVAAYYQYIDHDSLERELVAQTGDSELAAAVGEFLEGSMGRRVGLPQNNQSSHILADLYLDQAERELHRAGHLVWRYNDDFHFATTTVRGARRALEDLEAALRRLGLTPSDEKSMILGRERYQAWIEAPTRRRKEISDALDVDLDAWILSPAAGYEGEDPDDASVTIDDAEEAGQVAGALRALESWWSYVNQAVRDPLELYVNRQLARDAIRVLRRRASPGGIEYCSRLIAFEPELTHTVSRYLRALVIYGDESPLPFVQTLVEGPDHLSAWQHLWLLEPLWRSRELNDELAVWVESLVESTRNPDVLRARAAFVLAVHGRISPEAVGNLFSAVRLASRPDVVAAMAWLSRGATDPALRAFTRESPLYRFVAEYVFERRAAA